MRERERILASVSDCLWSGYKTENQSVCYRYFSPVVERMTGLAPEKILASKEQWMDFVHPDDRAKLEVTFANLFSAGHLEETIQYRVVLPSHDIRWVEDKISLEQKKKEEKKKKMMMMMMKQKTDQESMV